MSQVILRLTLDTNAVGPFNIYTGSTATTPILSNKTRDQLVAGIPYDFPAEPDGTTYTLIFENLQPGCEDQTITKRFTLTGNLDVIDLSATYSSGSVIANYFARSRQVLDKPVHISFTNILGVTSGSPVVFNPTITIPQGGTTGSTVVTDSGANFNLLDFSSILSGVTFATTGASQFDFSISFNPIFPTPTPSPTINPSNTPTPTPTITPTLTGVTSTPTATPTPTETPEVTVTPSNTVTTTPTPTPTNTVGVSQTPTPTNTVTPSVTPSSSPQETVTPTPTNTVTPSETVTPTPSTTPQETATPTPTPTPDETVTPTPTLTPTTTPTPSVTSSETPTPTPSNTADVSQTPTPTNTATPSVTPSISVTPSVTPSITASVTPSVTPEETATPTPTTSVTPSETPSVTPTNTPTPTETPTETPTSTPTETPTSTPTETPVSTPTSTPTGTPESTTTPTPTPTETPQETVTPTVTTTPSVTPSSSVTPSVTPDETATPTPTPTVTPSISVSPTSTPEATATPTPTPTATSAGAAPALLFIEPQSRAADIGLYINNEGSPLSQWYGFTNNNAPDTTQDIEVYMEMYATSGVTGLPPVYTSNIPQDGSYNFEEIIVPDGTVSGDAWYTFLIPQESIGNSTNRVTEILQDTSTAYGNTISPSVSFYDLGLVNYTGSVFANTEYRLYTTYPASGLKLNNSLNTLYFKGGSVS
jgi:hypothetical protein